MIGKRRIMRRLALVALALLLFSGCQPGPVQRTDVDLTQSQMNWDSFLAKSRRAEAASAPYNAVLSIRYKSPDKSHRFTSYFWSNAHRQTPYPVRLDIQGALGATVAKLYENDSVFVLYDTDNNTAHTAQGSPQAMLQMGLPLPVRLGDLSLLLTGRYAEFFIPEQDSGMPKVLQSNTNHESVFLITNGPRAGELTLDSQGRPLLWTEPGKPGELRDQGWRLEFSYIEGVEKDSLPGPQRVLASHPQGYSINILVRDFNRQRQSFSPEQLELILPADAQIEHS